MIKSISKPLIRKTSRFATKLNQNDLTRSSFLSTKIRLVRKDFIHLLDHPEHLLLCSIEKNKIDGVIACFKHPHQDYMDCAGPFFTQTSIGFDLINEVMHKIEQKIHLLFFFDHRHQLLIDMIKSLGGSIQGDESQLVLKRGEATNLSHRSCISIYHDDHKDWLSKTHQALFPEGYIPIDDLLNHQDQTRQTWIIFKDDIPVGYVIIKSYPDYLQRKTIEMIGVLETYRHQGLGKALLSHAIRECFSDQRVQSIDLIVENINTQALKLYTHLGFTLFRKNVNMIIPKKI